MTRARDLASLGDNTSKLEQAGLIQIIPSSVAVGSGTGSADSTGKVTFSGCSSVSLNNCFSASYDNYLILIEATHSAGSQGFMLRMRASGTDATGSNYNIQRFESNGTSNTSGRVSNASSGAFGYVSNLGKSCYTINLFAPFKAESTMYTQLQQYKATSSLEQQFTSGNHLVSTSYDGITIFPETSGTITGYISVYGYN